MPRHPDAIIEQNKLLSGARKRLPSPQRSSQPMSRRELADRVNAALDRLYDIDATGDHVDSRWIGKLERGEHRWPSERRRTALRAVLEARSDAEIGLYSPRRTDDGTAGPARELSPPRAPATIDTSVAHPARRYNYWLGGKDHFAVDRESGDLLAQAFPDVVVGARANRAFLQRAVQFAAEAGIRQFLDVGTGLPAPDNTHQVAQRVSPDARVVYVDNDPIVRVHAQALTVNDERGRTAYLEADLRQPSSILQHPTLAETLDLSQPVGLVLAAVLHFVADYDESVSVVRQLLAPLPAGSHLIFSHFTLDFRTAEETAVYEEMLAAKRADAFPRTKAAIAGYFDGLTLEEPGLVAVSDWRPADNPERRPSPAQVSLYGAVARVPADWTVGRAAGTT